MHIIFIPFLTLLLTESLKTIIQSIKEKSFKPSWFLRSGGMPSGHSSFTSSIATIAAYIKGWDSVEFLIALGFAVIVMYDARGVRQAVSKHAKTINKLIIKKGEKLDESIGHTTKQVIVGCLIGVVFSLCLLSLT